MENMIEVSVIMPIYNAESTIKRCIDSILAQDFNNFELILIDDGSMDSTPKICDDYAQIDNRIIVIHQENSGVSSARNIGLKTAKGKWIAFCDSDDTVKPFWLSSMLPKIPYADLVVCGYDKYRMDLSSEPIPYSRTYPKSIIMGDPQIVLETLIKAKTFQFIWNKLFRKAVIDKFSVYFDESFTVFEDEYFVLEYLSHINKVACVPDSGYNYYFPADYFEKYEFSITDFRKVVEKIYTVLAEVPGRVRLDAIIYWYTVALGRYASMHTFEQTRSSIIYGKMLATSFYDGVFNYLWLRILPPSVIYKIIRKKI